MQYISFYKDRLPFKPKSNVVIYFDVTGIGAKRYYHVLNEYYDRIVEEFRRGAGVLFLAQNSSRNGFGDYLPLLQSTGE